MSTLVERLHELQKRVEELEAALLLADRLCNEALPKFNWGASALDVNAIDLLNRAPLVIRQATEANRG